MSFRDVRVRNSNQETMSPSIEEPRVLVSICETNLNDQFEPSFRDNRDRNSQQETTSLPTRWNKNKKQYRDASRVVCKTFCEDMSYTASARNIPNNNVRLPRASWQDDDIDITCHQTNMPIQPRHRATKRRIETKNIRDGSFKSMLNSWHRHDHLSSWLPLRKCV